MNLPETKALKAFLKVCREFGVESAEFGELKLKFGDMPRTAGKDDEELAAHVPSDDELAYWSAQPDPIAARSEQ